MHKLTQTIRTTVLYVFAVALVGSVPMSAYADYSPACKDIARLGNKWTTVDGKCVKTPEATPTPTPSSDPTPSPSPSTSPSTTSPSSDPTSTDPTAAGTTGSATVDGTTNTTTTTTDNNTTTLDNDVKASSNSGDAKVTGNTTSGSAATGGTNTNSTVVNSVQSSVGGQTGVANFTYDINGNVVGDITIGTSKGPVDINNTNTVTGTTNINDKATINNDVDVIATSGNASVGGNKTSGSATSGDANATVNILNLINTIIASNQSFVGTINIYGNLNGDILMSPEFIPQLIAANSGSASTTSDTNLALSTTLNDSTSVINNIDLSSQSGNASVGGNKTSGSATSGTAQTNLTILNLTGHTVNAANSLLVFVNVLGTWVGMIVDAPGSTAAALGSNITSNTTNTISGTTNASQSSQITNNIGLTAQSGNATVGGNQTSGNATSGNATASANVANVSTSTFNLTGWFGVLYINVFGQWLGSFGVDTEAGTVTPVGGMAVEDKTATIGGPNIHFGFVPKTDPTGTLAASSLTSADVASTNDAAYEGAVLASAIKNGRTPNSSQQEVVMPAASPREDPFSVIMMITGFTIAGGAGLVWLFRRWF